MQHLTRESTPQDECKHDRTRETRILCAHRAPRHCVAPAWRQLPRPRSMAVLRPRTASEPGPAAPGLSAEPSRGRPSCSRPQRPPSLVMREEDQHLDQPPAMRRCRRCSNEGGTKSCEGRCCGSEGCRIDVRDMLRGQGVKKSEWWAGGAGCANRCERPTVGDLSCGVQRGTAPDCIDPRKSTMEMHFRTSFVRLIASFAANSQCDPCLAGVRMSR